MLRRAGSHSQVVDGRSGEMYKYDLVFVKEVDCEKATCKETNFEKASKRRQAQRDAYSCPASAVLEPLDLSPASRRRSRNHRGSVRGGEPSDYLLTGDRDLRSWARINDC
jgi:hypothetical protein